jgi:hypothetical protein
MRRFHRTSLGAISPNRPSTERRLGARDQGIAAFHVRGVEELTQSLREHGFILDAAV